MTVQPSSQLSGRVLDKRLLRQSVAALQARLGLIHDPTMTGIQAQEISVASGIKLEDRELSTEILRMREEKG
jgi:hypothetical protein